MTCPTTEELAALYDNCLPKKNSQIVRDHLARCPRCAHDLATLYQMLEGIGKPQNNQSIAKGLFDKAMRLAERPSRHSTAEKSKMLNIRRQVRDQK